MTAKRCLGYRSQTEAILALRARGLTTREISERVRIRPSVVDQLEEAALLTKKRLRERRERGRMILLADDIVKAMHSHAARRGMQVAELARCIIEQVVDDNLFDAVLDDGRRSEGVNHA